MQNTEAISLEHVLIKNSVNKPNRRALIFLFLTTLFLLAYMAPRWSDWNQNSRINLVRSIVEHRTVQIDTFQSNTGDYAFYKGHYYSDKPPGPALLGVVPYALLNLAISNPVADWGINSLLHSHSFTQAFTAEHPDGSTLTPHDKLLGAAGRVLLSILLVALPVAIMVCLFWIWCYEILERYWLSLELTLALLLGTTLFPYASLFYNHSLTASLLFISFFCLHRYKDKQDAKAWYSLVLVGGLLGFSLISEYETILIAGGLGVYALVITPRRNWLKLIGFLGLGSLPFAILIVGYDLLAFGTPLPIGYEYSTLWLDHHSQGFMSLTYPHLDALWGLTFNPYRGIFLLSPFLLLAIPGLWYGLRRASYKLEALVCLWAGFAFLCFNSSSNMWWGGHSFGPRYLIPCLPFVAFSVVFLLREAIREGWRGIYIWFGLPVILSIAIILPASIAGRQWPSDTYINPLTDYLWPQLLNGNLARTPASVIGLTGWSGYLLLIGMIGLIYLFLYKIWPNRPFKGGGNRNEGVLVQMSSVVQNQFDQIHLEPLKDNQTNTNLQGQNQKFFPLVCIIIMLVISTIPYLFGYLHTPGNKVFMGILLDVPDTTQYCAWMRGMQHDWLIVNPLTPETNDPIFFNLLWLVLGRIQALTSLDSAWVYQIFRFISIVFFGIMSWLFCKFIFERTLAHRTAFILIMFGCGWGWILATIKQFTGTLTSPLAVFVFEPNSFLSAMAAPHLIFSSGLMLGVFLLTIKAGESRRLHWAWAAGGVALILGLEHTYDLISVYGVLGIFFCFRILQKRRIDWLWFRILLIIGGVSAFPSFYFTLLTMTNPTWKGVLAQYGNAGVFTPDPFNLLILMGPLLLLAVVGLWAKQAPAKLSSWDTKSERLLFIKIWFVVGSLLIYIPTNFQIKMLNGWQIPVFMLSVAAILGPVQGWLRQKLSGFYSRITEQRWQLILCSIIILIALPTTFYLFSWRIVDLNRGNSPYYLQKDEVAAFNWLQKKSDPPKVVLSTEELGQYISAETGQRPFLAHWAMTLDYYTKRELVAEVFNPQTSPTLRAAIFKQYQVKYLLYGATEKKIAPELSDPHLHKVFTSEETDIYEVNLG